MSYIAIQYILMLYIIICDMFYIIYYILYVLYYISLDIGSEEFVSICTTQ